MLSARGIFMYRIIKALNNNSLLALDDKQCEVILLGKGIGFGRKNGERLEHKDIQDAKLYSLVKDTGSSALQTVNGIEPIFIEIAAQIIDEAEKDFQNIHKDILLPMADHIAMAVRRIGRGKLLPNPFHHDIMVMFPAEYHIAEQGLNIIHDLLGVSLPAGEAGYLSLHIHAGLSDENAAESLAGARLAAELIHKIELALHRDFAKNTLKYNRLMSHVCYMILRIRKHERVSVDMDQYVQTSYPEAYRISTDICNDIAAALQCDVFPEEIGLLALLTA